MEDRADHSLAIAIHAMPGQANASICYWNDENVKKKKFIWMKAIT